LKKYKAIYNPSIRFKSKAGAQSIGSSLTEV